MGRKKQTAEQYLAELAEIEKALPPADQMEDRFIRIFHPPEKPVHVKCVHCGKTYRSDEMRFEYRLWCQAGAVALWKTGEDPDLEPLWWCKNERCDGAGFGFDIFECRTEA